MTETRTPTPRHKPTPRRADGKQPQAPKPNGRTVKIALGAVAAIAVVALIAGVGLPALGSLFGKQGADNTAGPAAKVSFVGVGDNLPDDHIGWYADSLAGTEDDGVYDYRPIYKPIESYVQDADLAYINEEVHLGETR